MKSLEERVQQLEDREQIRTLAARYCQVIDDRDIEGIGDCFTENGAFRSKDGVMDARSRADVVEQFHGRFAVLGPSLHITHDHTIDFDADNPNRASGWVSSHAEVIRNGNPMLAAIRYEDQYEKCGDGQWRFADRLLWFFYYLDVREYAEGFLSPHRQRAYESPAPADIPEALDSWRAYYRKHPAN